MALWRLPLLNRALSPKPSVKGPPPPPRGAGLAAAREEAAGDAARFWEGPRACVRPPERGVGLAGRTFRIAGTGHTRARVGAPDLFGE